MHWSEKLAREIIKKKPNKELYTCAAGTSPSGSIHIGNFRDIATAYFVALALKRLGKNVRFLLSWDNYDRFRKVPLNVKEIHPEYEDYIGYPYSEIPDPYGCCESYARHFEKEYEASLAKFGIEVDFIYQSAEYKKGRYVDQVIHALKNRFKIYDIIMSFKTQDASEEEKQNYYPISIYCSTCHKDNTTVVSMSKDCKTITYKCTCGATHTIDITKDFCYKLPWKIDWPMRQKAESVDFEPGGKDHAAIGGSYQVSSVISREVFDYEPPVFQGYEFIGIKGSTGKMSGSSGLNMIPATLLSVYQPEVILWLYSKTEPTKAFDFCFDEEILRQYFEFDKMLNSYRDGKASEFIKEIMVNTFIKGREVATVPMGQLTGFGPICNWNEELLEKLFAKIGFNYKADDFRERLTLAKYWLMYCAPENIIELRKEKNVEYYETIDENQKKMVSKLYKDLSEKEYSLDELNTYLYSVVSAILGEMDDKTKKAEQMKFFETVYMLLIGRKKGPRLYLFLAAVDKNEYLPLLKF